MTDLYIVRHCETVANDQRRFAGITDADISERGARQLACLSEAFKDIKLDKVYSSSRIRARKTAMAMNKYSNAPMEIDEAFLEVNLGDWEDQFIDSIKSEAMRIWVEQPEKGQAPNGESRESVVKRGWAGIQKVVKENDGKTIGIASHGDLLRNVFQVLLKVPRERLIDVPYPDNVAVNHVRFYSPDDWEIITYNSTSHLTPDLVTQWVDPDPGKE